MIISERRRLRISIATLGLFVAGALCAHRVLAQGGYSCSAAAYCVPISLNANLQLTNLHPAVTHVQIECAGAMPNGSVFGRSGLTPVVSRGYTGSVTFNLDIPKSVIASAPTHAINVSCKLQLWKGPSVADAVASATAPQGVLDSNWGVLATGATVTWTQTVTFPNVNVNPVP